MTDSPSAINLMLSQLELAMQDGLPREHLQKLLRDAPPSRTSVTAASADRISLLIDAAGVVISQNSAAVQTLGLSLGMSIAEVAWSPESAQCFFDLIAGSDAPVPLPVSKSDGKAAFLMGIRTEQGGNIELSEVVRGIDQSLLSGLASSIGLTRSEVQALEGVIAGKSAEDVAADLNRKPSTVRQLIKDLMAKMGVHTQQQLISTVYSMSLMARREHSLAQVRPPNGDTPKGATLRIATTGKLGLHQIGISDGMPVLLFHGAIFGIAGHEGLRAAAEILGLNIMAPERPGYGHTPLPSGGDVVDLACDQAVEILDTMGIDRAILLCHDIGTLYGVRFAHRHKDRVAAIVAAPTTPPMQSWSQTADMPKRHRIHAWAAQNLPELMDKFVVLGLAQIARKGIDVLPKLVFDGCDFDQKMLMRPEMSMALQEAFSLAWAQEGAGFRMDMRLTNLNWQSEIAKVQVPVLCLHGKESLTVSAMAVARLAADLPYGYFHQVENAGHSMPLSHTAYILRQVSALARDCGLSPKLCEAPSLFDRPVSVTARSQQ